MQEANIIYRRLTQRTAAIWSAPLAPNSESRLTHGDGQTKFCCTIGENSPVSRHRYVKVTCAKCAVDKNSLLRTTG
jgi:hypothetical protein